MVVFTCNNCGETLQKPRVAKHYQFQCRSAPFLTCVDCFKDFRGEEYTAHTKCITEAERYGGKNYVPKASANKGERKQQQWLGVVNNLLNGPTILSGPERGFLQSLAKYDNIPRKKAKFLNFVQSALGHKTNMRLVESVWSKMEAAQKSDEPNKDESSSQENGNAKEAENKHETTTNGHHQENNIAENQNNENICRESRDIEQENGDAKSVETDKVEDETGEETRGKKKKKKTESKRREPADTIEQQNEEPVAKRAKQDNNKSVLSESSVNQAERTEVVEPADQSEKEPFDWKTAILSVVQSKGDISLKKLQKKVINRYMSHYLDSLPYEKACSKFNRKLKKIAEITISEERVKLA